MELITNGQRGILSRIVGGLRRAAATISPESDPAQEMRSMLTAGRLGGGLWLTPTELGLDPDGARSPAWYRTDLGLYAMRYQNGWGKAEVELPQDGKVTRMRVVSRKDSPRKAA